VVSNGSEVKKICVVQVWDTGGQQRYRPVLSTCYRQARGVLAVFDVTSQRTFANLPQWLREVDEFTAAAATPVPRLLVGNKSDLDGRREVTRERAEAFASENGMLGYVETSAVATENINEAFVELIKAAGGSSGPGRRVQRSATAK